MALRKPNTKEMAPPAGNGAATALAEPPLAVAGESADECNAVGQALVAGGHLSQDSFDTVVASTNGDLLELHIEGSSFCHQMVRSVASLAIEVGRGKRTPDTFATVLESRDRRLAHGAARAHGLTLTEVSY